MPARRAHVPLSKNRDAGNYVITNAAIAEGLFGGEAAAGDDTYRSMKADTIAYMKGYDDRIVAAVRSLASDGIVTRDDFRPSPSKKSSQASRWPVAAAPSQTLSETTGCLLGGASIVTLGLAVTDGSAFGGRGKHDRKPSLLVPRNRS